MDDIKLRGSIYPGTSKNMKVFLRATDVSGEFEIRDENSVFTAKWLGFVHLSSYDFGCQ